MTPKERTKPTLLNNSRKKRIGSGSGTSIQQVNQLMKQFNQMSKMMKMMQGGGGKKMMQMMKGIQVNEETLAKESYYESGPGENFLSTAHTLRNFATANYQSSLPDTGPYETWSENGSLTAAERANGIWKAMLANYEMPHMDESVDEALKDFMARRKESMPDEWY